MKTKPIHLTEQQIASIRKLAKEKRLFLEFLDSVPLANDIYDILERLDIRLIEYPIQSNRDRPSVYATLLQPFSETEDITIIGVNSSDYLDNQIFAIAHELYHFFTKSGSHLSEPTPEFHHTEALANRFAAEFILPEAVLKEIIIQEFGTSNLAKLKQNTLLRFISRIHCTWWLPYRSILHRLIEIGEITRGQFEALYKLDERDENEVFARICLAFNPDVFTHLNRKTNSIGISPSDIELIIRNFEDGLISEDEFTTILELFQRKPSDFGFDIQINPEDFAEFKEFFQGE